MENGVYTHEEQVEEAQGNVRYFQEELDRAQAAALKATDPDDVEEAFANVRYYSEQLNKHKTELLQLTR